MMTNIENRQASVAAAAPFFTALKIAGLYIVIAGTYIIASGLIVNSLVLDTQTMALVEKIKGMGFVAFTGILLLMLLYRHEKMRNRLERHILKNDRREVMALCNATVAHDINNFLMGLMGLVEEIKDKEQEDGSFSTIRQEIEGSIEKITQLSRSFAHSEREKDSFSTMDLSKQVKNTLSLLRKHSDVQKCHVTTDKTSSVSLNANVVRFEHMLMNLIINAAQATGKGGQIEISSREEDSTMILEVHDNGPGIPMDKATKIFRTGYTDKTNGSGLGMLSVRAFAASCNGKVSIGQSHLSGAVVGIHIPVTEKSSNETSDRLNKARVSRATLATTE